MSRPIERAEPLLGDGSATEWAAVLDAWAAEALDDAAAPRLGDALARWRSEVGELRGDDADFEIWAASRADWLLVEQGLGDATANDDERRRLQRSFVGLFEVWPTERGPAWLRDRIGGVCLTLADGDRIGASTLDRAERGPAALWELRGFVEGAVFVPCRFPIAHPVVVADLFGEPVQPDLDRPARWLAAVRRARLGHGRMPRADPRPVYREALRVVAR